MTEAPALTEGGCAMRLDATHSLEVPRLDLACATPSSGRSARNLTWHYYGAMLSASIVTAVVGSASAYATGGQDHLPQLLVWIAALLAGVNLGGAVFLYRPIRHYLAGSEPSRAELERRVRALPVLSGVWVLGLTAVAMVCDAAVARGSWGALTELPIAAAMGTAVHLMVFAIYLGFYAYLLVQDHLISLRRFLWKQGCEFAFPRRRFAIGLISALLAVGLGPVAVAMSDQWSHHALQVGPHMSAAQSHQHGQFMNQTLHMDVLAALLLAVMVVVLVARGLSRPVQILLEAMRRVDSGDFSTKAPVVTDDEFGMLTARFNRMVDGLNERERMRRTFAYFVPESIAAALLSDQGAIEPHDQEATILFSDIEQFSRIAAGLKPREVLSLLNSYFDLVANIIHRRSGVITQFQGDAVLASFNLPVTDKDHARHALEAALEIEQALDATIFSGGVRLRIRVGICTGLAVGGTVGGGERLGYTVHGDTVNLASRIEELNKALKTRILLSERTAELLSGRAALRDLGLVEIRGFDAPIRVFEPIRGSG
jgi:class 3 adenylate cyclase